MVIVLIFLTIFVLAFGFLGVYFLQPRQPPNPGGLIRNSYLMGFQSGSLWTKVEKLAEDCTKNGGVTRFLPGLYLITDPEAATSALNACLEKGIFYQFWLPWLGHGAVMAPVPIWKVHRKLLNPSFGQRNLEVHIDVFNQQSRRLVQQWMQAKPRPFDPFPDLAAVNLDTLCMTLFGYKGDQKTYREYSQAIHELNCMIRHRFERFWLFSDYIYRWTPTKKREMECLKIIHGMSSKIISARKATLDARKELNAVEENNNKLFIDVLLEFQDSNAYTEKQVCEEVDTFLFGGHDSSSTTLMYTLVLLGSHPDVQDKVYDELQEVLGSSEQVTKDDLLRLVYLEAVIKESMRLYPFAPFVSRYVDESVELKNFTLPRGSTFFVLSYGTHRHPVWGVDAEQFRPERWLDPATLPTCPGAFVSFSWGKRSCIGRPFAMMAMKTMLAHLMRQFKVTADHTRLRFELDVVLKPTTGHHIVLQSR